MKSVSFGLCDSMCAMYCQGIVRPANGDNIAEYIPIWNGNWL